MTPQELKNSILQRAIEGKLVEQRKEEGTGAELFEKIQKGKNKLVEEGRIKKQKALPQITEDEIPFDIPENWKLVRLGEISTIARGGSPRPIKDYITLADDGINWIKIGDTEKNSKYINSTIEKIKPEGLKKSRLVKPGDFLLTNSMSYGRPYILNIEGCIHDGWLVISQDISAYNKDFLYWMLSSGYSYNQFSRRVSGAVVKNLNSDKVSESVFPLPPLAEQKRIVDKIEELMPLVDEYEKNWQKLEELNKKFPEDMKKSLLQEAIKGKLVEQRPEEGTGEELYKLIQEEKNKLVEEEILFDIPEYWNWVKLGQICNIINGFTPRRTNPEFWNGEIPWFTIEDVREQGRFINYTNQHITEKALSYKSDRIIPRDTVLLCCTASVGEYAYTNIPLTTNQQFNGLVIKEHYKNFVSSMYLYIYSQTLKDRLISNSGKTTFNYLSVGKLKEFVIPLPPLAEQKRIVEKLDEMLPYCDELLKII
ncbi:MAG: restriction endonuclease subunit S [Finegoldia magna]|nr:restriction endonuclease subunit S [Finegoldia magna]